jgi:anti-anti-sigma factor
MPRIQIFSVERDGASLIVVPLRDLGSLSEFEIEEELKDLLGAVDAADAKQVIVDFDRVPYFGSTMISVLIKLWKTSRARGGRLALCNLSPREVEVLRVMKMERLWPSYGSRQETLAAAEA